MVTSGAEESDRCRELKTRVNVYLVRQKSSLPRCRFLDVTQRSLARTMRKECSSDVSRRSFGGALRDIQKTAARETSKKVAVVEKLPLVEVDCTLRTEVTFSR